jgi:hypothetical protein
MDEDKREYLRRKLDSLADDALPDIRILIQQVDTGFVIGGRMNSPSWMQERAQAAVYGLRSAGAEMMAEVRSIAGADAPSLAEDTGTAVARLGDQLVKDHRERVMPGKGAAVQPNTEEAEQSCQQLEAALREQREAVIYDLKCRPTQSPTAQAPLVGTIISGGGHVAVAGRDAVQHIEALDVGELLGLLQQVRQDIEASHIAPEQRERLIDDVAAIEVMAKQPDADKSRLLRLTKRLWDGAKEVGLHVAAGLLEAYAKQRLGLP